MKLNKMKGNKIKTILLITVLLITTLTIAIPIVSAKPSDYLSTYESGTATWSTTKAKTGDWSTKLAIPSPYTLNDAGRVALVYTGDLNSIASLSYWYFVDASTPETSGMYKSFIKTEMTAPNLEPIGGEYADYPTYGAPYLVIELDVDRDGTPDTWVIQAKFAANSKGTWVQDIIESGEPFHVAGPHAASTGFTIGVNWGSLSEIKAATETIGSQTYTLGAASVLKVKLAIGEWDPNQGPTGPVISYVDDVMIAGVTYPLEPIVLNKKYYRTGETVVVTVVDIYENKRPLVTDTIKVEAASNYPDIITVTLTETGIATGVFVGKFTVVAEAPGANDLLVKDGSTITVSYESLPYTATIDAKKPTIDIVSPTKDKVISTDTPVIKANLADTGSGIASATMKLDGVLVKVVEAEVSTIAYEVPSYPVNLKLSEGPHTVEVVAYDKVGNSDIKTWSFTVDLTRPTVSVAVNPDPAKVGAVTFTLTFNEDMDITAPLTVKFGKESPYITNEVSITSYALRKWVGTFAVIGTTVNGLNTISISGATDEAGNVMVIDTSKTFTIDTVAPIKPSVLTATATKVSVKLTWTASTDAGTGVKEYNIYRADTPIATVLHPTLTYTDYGPLSEPTYTYKVEAVDYVGNKADAATVSVAFVPGDVIAYPVELVKGWNLISLPMIPQDSSIEVVLSDVLENVNVVYGYEAGTWLTYLTSAPEFATLTDIEDGKGYWVKMTAADTLIVYGTEQPLPPDTPRVYNVYNGWNLIGFKSIDKMNVEDYLTTIPATLTGHMVIYEWSATSQGYKLLCAGPPDKQFSPSNGYWLYLIGDAVIVP